MSAFSPAPHSGSMSRPDSFTEYTTTTTSSGPSRSSMPHQPQAGPSTGGLYWNNGQPMLRMDDAVVETVITKTTRTTTSYAPIPLPRLPVPESISLPHHLSPESYPLANEPPPEDMKIFAVNIGGRRVVIQDDNTLVPDHDVAGVIQGPGWTRTLLADGPALRQGDGERLDMVSAINWSKGKEVRKRPHEYSHSTSRRSTTAPGIKPDSMDVVATPHISADPMTPRPRRSPPRKKIRGLDDITIPTDNGNVLLSPTPSPEQEVPPLSATAHRPVSPSIGSGTELAALLSLPSLVAHFETLPDKLQQQVLMHLMRRSRMSTIQRVSSFAGKALKRDFLTHLPHEIAVQILENVDTPSLAAASRVSRKWHKMIDSERSVWRQRLIADGLFHGHGMEEEEEALLQRRLDNLEARDSQARQAISRASTPTYDEPMRSATSVSEQDQPGPSGQPYVEVERPLPLKHVYRRRMHSSKAWMNQVPEHSAFPGHGTNVVTCLQFDADKIVSASDDHSINVYDTNTGQLRRRLDGHEGGVWALEYKGDTLVSGSTDRTVRIWDLETLSEAHIFYGHTSTVRCLQIVEPVLDQATGEYQPPYPMIVTGSRDAGLRVWKLPKKGEPPVIAYGTASLETFPPEQNPWHIHHLEGHTQAVRALAAHGRYCVSGSYDHTVRVWDIVTGQCKHTMTGHEQKVYSIVYDKHRNRCASGSMDNTVKVWDVLTGECLQSLTGHTSLVGLLGISPNYLVSGAADASVRIWDANTHELKHTLASHSGAITCFQHDETKVVSGSDGTLKLWDIRTGQYIRDLVIGISSVWQVAFNGNLLVAASNRGGSTVFDVFDFSPANADKRQYPMDDYKLDRLGRPAWERNNPREPQAYQVDEMDGLESSSPADMMNYFASPERADRYSRDREPGTSRSKHGESSTTRRSSRLAARTSASAAAGMPGWTGHLSEIEPGQSQGQSHGSSQTQGSSSRRHVKRILSRPGPSDHGHGHGHIQRLNRIAQQGSPTPIGPSGSNGGLGGSGVAGPSTRASGNAGGMGMGIRASGSSADQGRSFPPIFDEGDELMDEYVKTEDEGDGAGGSGSGGGEVDQLAEGNVEQIDQERDQWDV